MASANMKIEVTCKDLPEVKAYIARLEAVVEAARGELGPDGHMDDCKSRRSARYGIQMPCNCMAQTFTALDKHREAAP